MAPDTKTAAKGAALVHQPDLISGCYRMLLVPVFGLSKGF
jgi:hypothetical protein